MPRAGIQLKIVVLAAMLVSQLTGTSIATTATEGPAPRLLLVVDGPIRGGAARAIGDALTKGLSQLPADWRVAVVGARRKRAEASPLFYAKDLQAIRNAALALSYGDVKLEERLEFALKKAPANASATELRLVVLVLRPLAASDLASLKQMVKMRKLTLAPFALAPQAEVARGGEKAAKSAFSPEVLAEKLASAAQEMRREHAAAVKAAKARAAANATKKWTWRHWLYVGGGALALLVLFRMIWGVFSRGRVRSRMRRTAAKLREERAQAEEAVKMGHATIVDAVADLLAFVGEVYAIFPCKRCEEALFKLKDVTSNGRSIELACDACGLGVWAKCGITEPPPDLDQNFDMLSHAIEANRKAGKKIGLELSYPPILVQSNVQFEEDASGKKVERVIVRERITARPKLLIRCAYCQKTVYYEGRCPECGARRDVDGGA